MTKYIVEKLVVLPLFLPAEQIKPVDPDGMSEADE